MATDPKSESHYRQGLISMTPRQGLERESSWDWSREFREKVESEVGMAATLAGVCQVPLTSVLLLFELTQDYRIVLPLLGAVGLSSWITSSQNRKRDGSRVEAFKVKGSSSQQSASLYQSKALSNSIVFAEASDSTELCKLESSLCAYDSGSEASKFAERLIVSQAMKTTYITVMMSTPITEAVTLMLAGKQSCAVIIDNNDFPMGSLVLEDVEDASRVTRARDRGTEVDEILVSHICEFKKGVCRMLSARPSMTLAAAERIMDSYGVNQLPVVSEHAEGHKGGCLIGLLDRECIDIACRVTATKEILSSPSSMVTRSADSRM